MSSSLKLAKKIISDLDGDTRKSAYPILHCLGMRCDDRRCTEHYPPGEPPAQQDPGLTPPPSWWPTYE